MEFSSKPVTLSVAPNGAFKTKKDHPNLPTTPAELAETAAACCDAGAAMIHLHVRDRDGVHLLDQHAYAVATAAIRGAVGHGIVIQITSEAAGRYQRHEQMAVVRATKPEAVSIAMREIVPDSAAETEAEGFYRWLRSNGTLVQTILFSSDEVSRYYELRERGVFGDGKDFPLFVLGRYTPGQMSAPADLLPFLSVFRNDVSWAMCAFGRREHACAITAAALGGHVRVGFENNLTQPDGTLAADNAAQVRRVADGVGALGLRLGNANDLRALYS
ncbi:MAG: class III aminotransferase [Betaproteobacteria bacterium RIFCSPLOWO2_12_FULL_63_13]|nr:MAG: class III aminotransferase [Betaproteobacteria bacterium RIFCSPLOWO2_12_FULL_63_13]